MSDDKSFTDYAPSNFIFNAIFLPFLFFFFLSGICSNTLQLSIKNDENLEGQGKEKYSTLPERTTESFHFDELAIC